MYKIILIPFLALISFSLFSCNEDPTSLGFPIDTLQIYSISSLDEEIIVNSENQIVRLEAMYGKTFSYLGKYKDMTAISFIRYKTFPDSLSYVDESKIVSAKLRMKPTRYAFGDTTSGILSFDIYELQKPFTNATKWEDIYPNGNGGDENSDFFKKDKIGSFNGKITLKDTIDEFRVDISKKLIIDWLRFSEKKEESPFSYSYALIPNSSSTFISKILNVNTTLKFDTEIELIYNHKDNRLDTIKLPTSTYSTYFNSNKIEDENKIVIQGGVAYRSKINFDLSKLPEKSSIVKAQLELHVIDEECIYGNWSKDTTLVASMDSIISQSYSTPYAAVRESNSTKYVFPSISSAIQTWNIKDGKGSLTIYANRNGNAFEEYNNLDRYVFHGTKSKDITKRPKLVVFYTKRPNI